MIERDYSREYLPANDVPKDLVGVMDELTNTIRYDVPYYPPFIFRDQNVALHTRRSVGFGRREGMLAKGERIQWVHDVPEIKIGDLLIVETVANPQLQIDKEGEELKAAQELLTPRDQQLLGEFNQAGNFWKGRTRKSYHLAAAAKLIDILDGNVIFHEVVSQYCIENGVAKLDPRINPSFHYAFMQGKVLRSQLEFLADRQREWFRRIIDLQFEFINYYWQGVPSSLIPPALQEELAKQ